jgi:hypothetical protein
MDENLASTNTEETEEVTLEQTLKEDIVEMFQIVNESGLPNEEYKKVAFGVLLEEKIERTFKEFD